MAETYTDELLAAYTLTNPETVLEKLQALQRAGSLLSLCWDASGKGVTTTIVKLLPEKGLIALDAPPGAPAALFEAAEVSFSAVVQGADVRFRSEGVREATFNGQDVLAAPLPSSVSWVQRRENYRVSLPRGATALCRIPMPNDEIGEFEILNISLLGLALLDKSGRLDYWGRVGQIFRNCHLLIDELRDERVSLEIRNKRTTTRGQNRHSATRVGFAFKDLSRSFGRQLQRYVAALERAKVRGDE